MQPFRFIPTNDRPKGAIICDAETLELLKSRGWVVDMHTPGYANFIGVKVSGMSIGFSGYMDSLGFVMATPPIGYYGDVWHDDEEIDSLERLDTAVEIIELFIKFNKQA